MTALREGMPPLPARMQSLPIDDRGYPVPYFVAWLDGKPDFRVTDPRKWMRCYREQRCWVCGDVVGKYKTFVIGPMCAVNRTTAEPPCHVECAVFSATACPFLTLPKAQRREANLPTNTKDMPGVGLLRNPGVTCLWTTLQFEAFKVDNGVLIRLGDPTSVAWYAEKQHANRTQVLASIDSGMPILRKMAEEEGPQSIAMLDQYYQRMLPLLPTE